MSSLLTDLRRAPTPLALQSREPIIEAVKAAQVELLRIAANARSDLPNQHLSIRLRRYALWLENAIFVAGEADESSLEVVAALYEYAGQLTEIRPSTIFRPPLNDFARSAIVASRTTFPGKATVVSSRVEDRLTSFDLLSPVDQSNVLVARIIVALLGRRLEHAIALGRDLHRLQTNAGLDQEREDAPQVELDSLNLSFDIGMTCSRAALGLLTGTFAYVESSIRKLAQITDSADQSNDANLFWLSDRLRTTIQSMYDANMHRLVGFHGSPIPSTYRQMLAQEGFLELWGPQLDALRQGLLDADSRANFVITIPTGSGKTMMAELLSRTALAEHDSWGVYVAPSRSLVSQISHELRRRLEPCGVKIRTILAGAESSFALDEELNLLPQSRSIVVTTPEKLDTYYRNGRHLFENCSLLIVDEAHKVADPTRGRLIETLVARFLTLNPTVRIALLSGVMSNPEEFADWLGPDNSRTVVEWRRPTRHLYGVAVRQSPPIHVRDAREKFDRQENRSKTIRRVDFAGGLVVVNEHDDLSVPLEVDLPNLFQGHYWERLRDPRWIPDRRESGSPVTDHAR